MAMTNARRGMVVLGLVATACIAWVSWAWSPSVDQVDPAEEAIAGEPAPAPAIAVSQTPSPPVPKVDPPAPKPSAPAPEVPDASLLHHPERIPTPHAMSLDQTKPPEQSGPLAELKNQYASESRSADSSATEAKLRGLISESRNVPSELVQNISCRRSVCKLELQWTARRRIGFAVVSGSFKQMYNQRVAVEAPSGRADDGTYPTTLYLQFTP
jgi:type IV secretory pathway VirB10-like protein